MALHRANVFQTRFVTLKDKGDWRVLYNGYADFYRVEMTDAIADATFRWLLDPGHVLEGLITRDVEGRAVGMAHIRACPRPLGGHEVGFLDDLFVTPDARGQGAADAIFESLNALSKRRGWSSIRWVTQHFNDRGRRFYDRYTEGPSDFIMYQWTLS